MQQQAQGPLPPGTQPSAEPYGPYTPLNAEHRERLLPRGDYSKGHPGLPPKNYKAPREKR
jgi:hypothetical protein